jgi:hypothetical protein
MAQSFFGQNDPVVASTVPAEAVPEVVASDVEDAAPAIPTIAAAEDRRIRRKFDVASALKSGRSFTEIADELAALNNFDAEEARKSTIDPATGKKIPGYSDEEIISKLVDIRNISNVQAFGEGAITGITEAGGMLIGGKLAFDASLPISAGVGALFPPAAPFTVPATIGAITTLGALTGGVMAGGLDSYFGPEKPLQFAANEAGRTFGAGIVPLPIPYLSALKAEKTLAMGPALFISNYVKKYGNVKPIGLTPYEQIVRTASERPLGFAAFETGANVGAALGANVAEKDDPGNTLKRMGFEMGGALFANPAAIISKAWPLVALGLENSIGQLTPQGRTAKLGRKLVSVLKDGAEDPLKAIERLRADPEFVKIAKENNIVLGDVSSAVKSGSPVLAALQKDIDAKLKPGPTLDRQAFLNLKGISDIVKLMSAMDDPAALAAAAELQRAQYDAMLSLRLNQAEQEAADTAGNILVANPLNAKQAGEVIREQTLAILREAREQEKALYRLINKTESAEAGGIIAEYDRITSEILPESPFPSLIRRFVARAKGEDIVADGPAVNSAEDAIATIQIALAKSNEKLTTQSTKYPAEASFLDTYIQARKTGTVDEYAGQKVKLENEFLSAEIDFTKRRMAVLREELEKQFSTRPDLFSNPKAKAAEIAGENGARFGSRGYSEENAAEYLRDFGFDQKRIDALFESAGVPNSAQPKQSFPTAAPLSKDPLSVSARARAAGKDTTDDEVAILQELLSGKLDLPGIGKSGGNKVQDLARLRLDSLMRQNRIADYQAQSAATVDGAVTDAPKAEMTIGDLINFRSEMLAMSRDSRAAGNFRDSNFYGKMSEAAMDDIGLRGTVDEGIMPTPNQTAIKNANSFSLALNDTFTRAFAGTMLGKQRTGASRIPPELVSEAILGGSANATNLKITQLQQAADFLAANSSPELAESAASRLETVRGAQDTILRGAAAQFYNQETGRVNIAGLTKWISQNSETLDLFPALKDDLANSVKAQKVLSDTLKEDSVFSKGLSNQLALGAFIGEDEIPMHGVHAMLGRPGDRPKHPVKNLNAAAKSAKQAGLPVVAGLKDAILDHAFADSGGPDKTLSFKAFKAYLYDPIASGQDSIMAILRNQGIINDAEAVNIGTLLREASFIEDIILQGEPGNFKLQDKPAAMVDLVVSALGAREGTRLARMLNMGGSLILPAKFASYARSKFIDMPSTSFGDLIVAAAKDPELMALMLDKGMDAPNNRGINLNKQLRASLISTGLLPVREEVQEADFSDFVLPSSANAAPAPNPQDIQSYLDNLRPPPTPRPAPDPAPRPAAPAPQAQPVAQPAPAPTTAESSYSALFPNDMISPMLNARTQQGIGALMPR